MAVDGSDIDADYIIVGAGASGCVIANRLTERPDVRVLVLEAGCDVAPGEEPADIRDLFPLSSSNRDYFWPDVHVHWRRAENSPRVFMSQGRLVGGGSSVMGMWAMRGGPDDYADWVRAGADGWGWDDVLPYFRKLETDCDFDGPLHGTDGPIPIRRLPYEDWSPFARALLPAAERLGLPHIKDMNAEPGSGYCSLAVSRYAQSRASAGLCYLDRNARARPNLVLMTGITVTRLVAEDGRIVGVAAVRADGAETVFRAREVIVTAGALKTPVLLMRSGIGPGGQLRAAGLPVVADRPGVGRNLQTHPILVTAAFLKAGARHARLGRPPSATYIRWASQGSGRELPDMTIYVRSFVTWHAIGRRMAMLAPVLGRPNSRGSVRIDAQGREVIEFNFLADAHDQARLAEGMRLAANLFAAPEVQAVCGDPFVIVNAQRLGRFNYVSRTNALLTSLAGLSLDLGEGFGRAVLGRMAEFKPLRDLVNDPEALARFATDNVAGTYHVCGTARMGRSDDATAVVDTSGRVFGVPGLRVADASVMPQVVSVNTHIPVVMVAEKLADAIKADAA